MRKLIVKMSVSVDGFVGGPNGEIDWLLKSMDDTAASWIVDTLWQAGVHIMGSRTFYDMVSYWPYSDEPFAAPMNKIPKVVFSRMGIDLNRSTQQSTQALKDSTSLQAESSFKNSPGMPYHMETWNNATVASGNLAHEINRLKQQDGKPILAHGGASFIQSLAATGLIDEYRLLTHPVALGKGLPLFSALQKPLDLNLVSTTVFGSGCVAHVYRPSANV
ncbi:MAG: bifunctional deaminase-reductase-like protein [Mucilaginibacter sp.]|nr:bifunctional deaminase-reductase-like protein [Mucilaginibacter sp.]